MSIMCERLARILSLLLLLHGAPLALSAVLWQTPEGGNQEENQEEIQESVEEDAEELEERLEREAETLEERLDREAEEREARIEALHEEIERETEERIEQAERQRERADHMHDRLRRRRSDNRVSIGNPIWIREDEVASDTVAILAGVEVDGEILGDVVAVGGSARINGRVTGSVTAVGGGVDLGEKADILGDVTSVGGQVKRHDDATVLGSVSEVSLAPDFELDLGDWFQGWDFFPGQRWRVFRWGRLLELGTSLLGMAILLMIGSLLVLVVPTPTERVRAMAAAEPWKAALVGLAVEILFLPALIVLVVLLAISIIGIPLLLGIPFVILGLVAAFLFGYTGSSLAVGRWLKGRFTLDLGSPYVMLLAGILTIQAFSLVGDVLDVFRPLWPFALLFKLSGFLIAYLAWTIGLGAVVLTAFGTRSGGVRETLPPPLPLEPTGETDLSMAVEDDAGEPLPPGDGPSGDAGEPHER